MSKFAPKREDGLSAYGDCWPCPDARAVLGALGVVGT